MPRPRSSSSTARSCSPDEWPTRGILFPELEDFINCQRDDQVYFINCQRDDLLQLLKNSLCVEGVQRAPLPASENSMSEAAVAAAVGECHAKLGPQGVLTLEQKDDMEAAAAMAGLGQQQKETIVSRASRWELTDQDVFARARSRSMNRIMDVPGIKPDEIASEKPRPRAEHNIWVVASKFCASMIRSVFFDLFFGAVIVLNGILVGVEVEYCARERASDAPVIIAIMGNLFSVLFIVELLVRVVACGRNFFRVFDWAWNLFDLIAVASSALELILLQLFDDGASFLLFARIIRIVRVVRLLRLLRFLRELKTMIISILQTLPSLIWSMTLLSMIIYMFAIVLTGGVTAHLLKLPGPTSYSDDLFASWGTLSNTMYTMFMAVSGGVNWGIPARDLERVSVMYLYMFMAFQCFVLFALLNVITGFFCENAIKNANQDRENLIGEQLRDKDTYTALFKDLFDEMDADKSGGISLDELEVFLYEPRLQAIFAHLNINVLNAWTIFRLLDTDVSGDVSIDEFVTGLLRIRGPAKTIDVRSVHHDIKRNQRVMTEFMEFAERRFDEIQNTIALDVDKSKIQSRIS